MQMSVSTAVQVYLGVVNKLIVMGNVVGLPCLKLLQIPCLVRSLKVEFVNSIIRLNTMLRCLTGLCGPLRRDKQACPIRFGMYRGPEGNTNRGL